MKLQPFSLLCAQSAFDAITGRAHLHHSLDMLDNQDVTSHLPG